MASFRDHAGRVFVALAIGVVLLVPRAAFLLGASDDWLVTVVPDDAFYYLGLAQNIAAGHGATFDGVHPTNGYHPLWLAILVPVAALARDPTSLLRAALALGTLFHLASALLAYRILRRATTAWYVPLLGVILYSMNPRAVVSSLNGLETSLSTFLFTALLWATLRIANCGLRIADFNPKSEIRNPKWVPLVMGLLMGLLFLARTDNVFFVAVFYLAAVVLADRGQRLRRALIIGAAAAALAVPWVAHNWAAFGSPVQVSGLSIPYVHHELYRLEGHTALQTVAHGLKQFAVMLYEGLRGEIGYSRLVSFPALALSLLIFLLRWRNEAAMPRAMRRAVLVLLALGLASLAHLFVHAAIRWYPRPWYFDQLLVLLPIAFGLALAVATPERWLARVRVRPAAAAALLAVALPALGGALAYASGSALNRGEWPWAVEMLDSARWLRHNTGKDAVAAAFNAGIIGYYSERRVVNLDGAVNNAAYDALRRKDLMGLMRRAKVTHYLDFEPMMLNQFRPFLGPLAHEVRMRPLRQFQSAWAGWGNSHIQIFALEWPQEGTKEE